MSALEEKPLAAGSSAAGLVVGAAAGAVAGYLLGLALWSVTFGARVDLARLSSAKALDAHLPSLDAMTWGGAALVAAALLAQKVVPPLRAAVVVGTVGLVAVILRATTGPTVAIPLVLLALAAAVLVAARGGAAWRRATSTSIEAKTALAAFVPGLVAVVLYSIWSVHRHQSFGSGSWDMGCYNHNIWLFAHGKPWVSSVLGDANFWGGTNHFMPSLALAAPLAWTGSTWALLVLQAVLIGLVVLPLTLLARRRGLGPAAVFGLSVAFLFHVGTQSTANFDVHEIVPVPFCLLLAVWAFETKRRAVAYVALLVAFGTKESAILYVAAFGLFLAVCVRGHRLEGLGIAALCVAAFFFVTGWLQPRFLEEGSRGMIHAARFAQFGDGLVDGALNMLAHPGRTLLVLFSPAQKTETLVVTFGTFGFLPLASPEALLLASFNLVERFLSDKREMWGLGFHYSLVLVGISAYGALQALARARDFVLPRLARARPAVAADAGAAFDLGAGAFLVLCTIGVGAFASPIAPELSSLDKPYFSTPAQIEINRRALRVIPDDAKVVAQNHFLPHLALREFIWQPEPRFVKKAEYVILNPTESPWPHSKAHVVRLTGSLLDDPAWQVVFSEGTTIVFARAETGRPAVAPAAELLAAIGRAR